jgi:hypothetical protein
VQVFFGAQEAQVISTTFNQIIVLSPPASTTSDNGSGAVLGPVAVRVVNINSATSVSSGALFRYTPKMQITIAGPNEGPFTGGTEIRIDGTGFDDPLTVVVAGVAARVIRVSGTQLLAITNGVTPTGCADIVGTIVVTNGDNGDSATGPAFTYRVPKPFITAVQSSDGGPVVPGSTVTVTVAGATGIPQLRIGSATVNVSGATQNANGTTTFTATVPPNIPLTTATCASGGSFPQPTTFDVVYTSALTTCSVTTSNGLSVTPVAVGNMFVTPNPLTLTARAGSPAVVGPPPVAAVPSQSGNGSFTIVNNGAAPITLTSFGSCPGFTVTGPPAGTVLQQCDIAVVSVGYAPQAVGTSSSCQVTVTATTGAGGATTLTRNESVIGITAP